MTNGKPAISKTKIRAAIIFGAIVIFGIIFSASIFETVKKGTYHVIQRPYTGTMEAKMKTGTYFQFFSDVKPWPKSETFFFTHDKLEGKDIDQSIEVRFVDGSKARISGTMRILLPTGGVQAIGLMVDMNFQDYDDLEARFILPIVRNSLRATANLMTARESYAEKRPDFVTWAWDQISRGAYVTKEETKTVQDPITKEWVTTHFKVIKELEGQPLRKQNPLENTGIRLANFEIKTFEYEDKVKTQISEQQKNFMAIATARAEAERAEQEAKTKEMQGKANVMKVRYQQLEIKEKAVITAEAAKKVAETKASQELEVAKLDKLAAAETKQKNILLGEGEAKRKQLVLAADGALTQKLATVERIEANWAEAYKTRNVPAVYMAGSGSEGGVSTGPDDQFKRFMNMMNIDVAKRLALDLSIPAQTDTKK